MEDSGGGRRVIPERLGLAQQYLADAQSLLADERLACAPMQANRDERRVENRFRVMITG